MELKIPVLALVDSDPYGLKILSVYMKGAPPPLPPPPPPSRPQPPGPPPPCPLPQRPVLQPRSSARAPATPDSTHPCVAPCAAAWLHLLPKQRGGRCVTERDCGGADSQERVVGLLCIAGLWKGDDGCQNCQLWG